MMGLRLKLGLSRGGGVSGPAYGPEVLTTPDFSSATGWTVGAPATISGGTGSLTNSNAAFLIEDTAMTVTLGETYTVTLVVNQVGDSTPFVALGINGSGALFGSNAIVATGTVSFDYAITSNQTDLRLYIFQNTNGTTGLILDSASVKEKL